MLWIVLSSFGSGIRLWHPCHHGTVRYCLIPVPIASKGVHANMSNASFLFVALNQRAFCESLVTRLGQASFVATAKFNIACTFDGEAPFLSNIFCCVDATEDLSEFSRLEEINATQYCFIAQINSDDQHRTCFNPAKKSLRIRQASHEKFTRSFRK